MFFFVGEFQQQNIFANYLIQKNNKKKPNAMLSVSSGWRIKIKIIFYKSYNYLHNNNSVQCCMAKRKKKKEINIFSHLKPSALSLPSFLILSHSLSECIISCLRTLVNLSCKIITYLLLLITSYIIKIIYLFT